MTSIGTHVSDRYRADSGELEERFPGVINPGSWGEAVIDAPKYFSRDSKSLICRDS